jgi:hypothetical protein
MRVGFRIILLAVPSDVRASKTDVRVRERGIEADNKARIEVWRSAGRIGRFWIDWVRSQSN